MCLEVTGSTNASGTAVDMNTAAHTSNQQWLVQQQSDGTYKIYAFSSQNSLQMLDAGAGTTGTAILTQEDEAVDGVTDTSQRWNFVDQGTGYYRIVPAEDGAGSTETLDIGGGDPTGYAGEPADIDGFTGSGNQLFKPDWSGPTQILPNPKKGVALSDFNAAGLNVSWVYTWEFTTPPDVPTGMEFVPMVWGWYGDTNIGFEVTAADTGMQNVLGYNEPDFPYSGSSNMSVDEALTGFQYISSLSSQGIGIVSPAPAVDTCTLATVGTCYDPWMVEFMQAATAAPYNYHFDAVAVHIYPGTDPAPFLSYIDSEYAKYQLPIWVTEFAPNGSGQTVAQAYSFVLGAVKGLNARPYVARYALFTIMTPSATDFGAGAMINTNGTYTTIGQLYSRL